MEQVMSANELRIRQINNFIKDNESLLAIGRTVIFQAKRDSFETMSKLFKDAGYNVSPHMSNFQINISI